LFFLVKIKPFTGNIQNFQFVFGYLKENLPIQIIQMTHVAMFFIYHILKA